MYRVSYLKSVSIREISKWEFQKLSKVFFFKKKLPDKSNLPSTDFFLSSTTNINADSVPVHFFLLTPIDILIKSYFP